MLQNHDYKTTKCVHAHKTFFKAYSLLQASFIFGTRLLSANLQRPKSGLSTKFGFAVLNNSIQLKVTPCRFCFIFACLFVLFSGIYWKQTIRECKERRSTSILAGQNCLRTDCTWTVPVRYSRDLSLVRAGRSTLNMFSLQKKKRIKNWTKLHDKIRKIKFSMNAFVCN